MAKNYQSAAPIGASFYDFMRNREKSILRGAEGVNPTRVGASNRGGTRRWRCEALAAEVGKAFPSDPFAARRMYARLMNGTAVMSDISVDWLEEERSILSVVTGEEVSFKVRRPINIKLP